MRLKLKFFLLSIALLSSISFFNGCLEEPTQVPITRPYSVFRVGNFGNNTATLTFEIRAQDGSLLKTYSNLAAGSFTNYEDIAAGKRSFKVTDGSGNVVFNSSIDITSYGRSSFIFCGFYSTVDTLNTFTFFEVDEGLIYVKSSPDSGSNIYLVHASNDEGAQAARKLDISIKYPDAVDSAVTTPTTPLKFSEVKSLGNKAAGSYIMRFEAQAPATDSISISTNLDAGFRYYMVINGPPNAMTVTENKVTPLPVRER